VVNTINLKIYISSNGKIFLILSQNVLKIKKIWFMLYANILGERKLTVKIIDE
jgi:hypothetical protein